MNVSHVPRRFVADKWGGTETYVLEAAKGLLERGHQAEIFTSAALSKEGDEDIQGISVHRFSYFYPYFGLSSEARRQLDLRAGNLFSTSLLARLLSIDPPDLFHLHTGKRMGGIIRTVARYHNRPYVVTLHGGVCACPKKKRSVGPSRHKAPSNGDDSSACSSGSRSVLEDAAAILCVNKNEQRTLQKKYPRKRIEWIPNSVSVAHFSKGDGASFRKAHGIPTDARVILNIGRIDPQKNQLDAIEIYQRLASEHPNTHMVLAGAETDDGYARTIKSAILNSPFSKQIHLLGALPAGSAELVDAYHGSNVFLLSSLHEPFGIVLLEAWAAGLPVVSANVGGVPSFVEDCRNGFLYSSGDISEAVSCLKMLLGNQAMRNTIRRNASESVQRFDVASSMETLIQLYKAVVREHSLRA